LPFWQAGYTVVYQTCCHNGQIRNIHDPKNTGVSFTAEISGLAQLTCNQAAIFDLWPPVAICIHHPLSYDHSASDADGDSLSYRLCAPFAGPDSLHSEPDPPAGPPYLDLQWIDPPYNLDNLLGGTPLSIDSISGLMTAIPNTLGAFVVGVCLDEYRNGEWLSTTRREFQYNVTQCTRPVAEISVPDIVCDEFEVAFLNESLQSNHFLWFFDWPMPNPSSTESAPVHVYSDTGNYTIALIVEPNTMCSDTSFAEIQLVSTGGTLELNAEPSTVVVGASTQLSALFPGAISYQWMPSTGLSNDQISNPTAIPSESTEYNVKALLSNGCVKTGSIVITVVEPPCAEPYLFFPTGFSPNGDGQNDELKLEGNNTLQVSWFIFNRWGEQVFEAQSLSDSWNGTFRGVPQPAEVYGYYLKVICTNGEEFVRKGNVTLIR
jgi:gliding motility-associated-like protein